MKGLKHVFIEVILRFICLIQEMGIELFVPIIMRRWMESAMKYDAFDNVRNDLDPYYMIFVDFYMSLRLKIHHHIE